MADVVKVNCRCRRFHIFPPLTRWQISMKNKSYFSVSLFHRAWAIAEKFEMKLFLRNFYQPTITRPLSGGGPKGPCPPSFLTKSSRQMSRFLLEANTKIWGKKVQHFDLTPFEKGPVFPPFEKLATEKLLEGGVPGARPLPQGSKFFCFNIQNFRNITALGVHAQNFVSLREILDPPLIKTCAGIRCKKLWGFN